MNTYDYAESLYVGKSDRFFDGILGGGIAKTIMTGGESAVILRENKNMNVELKCVGQMEGSFESANRIYDPNGLSPTIPCYHTDAEVKILEEREWLKD